MDLTRPQAHSECFSAQGQRALTIDLYAYFDALTIPALSTP